MALRPGVHLGPYEILSALGAGGMGVVYRAHNAKLDRDVAMILPEPCGLIAIAVAGHGSGLLNSRLLVATCRRWRDGQQ